MWKQAKESGLSLAELLVVLAITVVLAAILLPAISTPEHAREKADASLTPYVLAADGEMQIEEAVRPERPGRRDEATPAVDDSAREEAPELVPVESQDVQTMELDGAKKIKTTDISY